MGVSPVLPVEAILPELRAALRQGTAAVLVAPPGAGKTTRVPLALLHEDGLGGRRILMLEPRRLAARSVARYMAATLGEQVGGRVGYRVRHEARVGRETRVEVVTEGILTRMLQADPALEEVGLLIFDEFHERSLHADLGLALSLECQSVLRPDLRILVMSATLEAEPVAGLLGGAPVLVSEGRSHPVETIYLDAPPAGPVEPLVARTVLRALREHPGDVLVFLPGEAEIRRAERLLQEMGVGDGPDTAGRAAGTAPGRPPDAPPTGGAAVDVLPLYGALPPADQDRALRPSPPGRRKVVLASAVAETSLTVEGVAVVVDSGLMRVPRYSPRTGMSRLVTVPVTRDAADQRRGRAGRLGPGVCYRLWTAQQDAHLVPRRTPEIREADLAPLALELAVWGAGPESLRWLDPPPAAAMAQARDLLRMLGALDDTGAVTPHGRRMAELGVHPRLAHMLLAGAEMGLGGLACDLAAILSERDPLRGADDVDLCARLRLLRTGGPGDAAALRRVQVEAAALRRALTGTVRGAPRAAHDTAHDTVHGAAPGADEAQAGGLLSLAFPDRIAQNRGGGRFLLRSGRGAFVPPGQPLAEEPFLVAAELADQGAESRIFLAAALTQADLERLWGPQSETERRVWWDREAGMVRAAVRQRLGALRLREAPWEDPDPDLVAAALLEGIRQEGMDALPWDREARQVQQRIRFMAQLEAGWPDVSDEALAAALADWLGPHISGLRRRDEVQRLRLGPLLLGMLTWEQRRALDEEAPTHITVPSGSRHPIDYSDPAAPVLAVRLQEVFGWTETPRVGRGRVPLTLHLLSPAHRPVQVTRDLASFWREGYFLVRKELRGRYPKHYWPEDPLTASPTNRTRPRA